MSKHILNTRILKDYFSMNISLENYDGLTNPREHVKNIHSSLELIIQDHDSMCKLFPTTFKRFGCAWNNNLKPNSIEGFNYLYVKLVARFNTGIPSNKPLQSFLVLPNKRASLPVHI